jgi:hypothetical protein
VPFTPIDMSFFQDDHTECQAIKVTIDNFELAIFNVYLPPVSSCPCNYKPDLDPVFLHADDDVLMCGDFNAYHEGWHSSVVDSRGKLVADQIKDSPLIALNLDAPTRLPSSGSPTSPDITLASAHIALAATWLTHVRLNSDHLLITISMPSDGAPPFRAAKSSVNFRKADWAAYVRESEAEFRSQPLPFSCGAGKRVFCNIQLRAAKHAIPAGYHPDFVPGMTQEAVKLIHERDELRSADPQNPGIEAMNQEISRLIAQNKR